MSDFITNLSQRILGTASLVHPRFPALFAPQRAASEGAEFVGSEEGAFHGGGFDASAEPAPNGTHRSSGTAGDDAPLPVRVPADRPDVQDRQQSTDVSSISSTTGFSRRTLLPPLPPLGGEKLPEFPGETADNPFSSSEGDIESKEPAPKTARIRTAFEQSEEEARPERSEGKTTPVSTGGDRGEDKGRDRLLARTIERTISKDYERHGRTITPRRLVPPDRMTWRDDVLREELRAEYDRTGEGKSAEGFLDFPDDSERFVSPRRVDGEERMNQMNQRENDRTRHSVPTGAKLLVPGHTHRAEEEKAGELLASVSIGQSEKENASSRTINVTIGRIEVRGTPERKTPPVPVRPPAKKGPEPTPVMSLDDYLKRYNGRGG